LGSSRFEHCQIPIYRAGKFGRVREVMATTQGTCEIGCVVLIAADSNETIAGGNRSTSMLPTIALSPRRQNSFAVLERVKTLT
jgi:hypothetical protein